MDRRRPPSVTDAPPGCCICFVGFMGKGYNDPRKPLVPLVLKCTHSSCDNCILACLKMNKPITCGVCQEVTPFPPSCKEEDIRALFPVNMHLLGLWSRRTKEYFDGGDSQISFPKKVVKKEIVPKKSFKSCNECTGPANCFCESCLTAYCHLCFKKVHAAAKVLKDHKSVSLIQEPGASTSKTPNFMCTIHHDKKLELFCTECYVSICSACLVTEHNGHNLKSIADQNKEFVDEIIASYARVTDVMNVMKASTKKAKQAVKCPSVGSSNLSQEQRIKQHFVQLHAHLEILENDLLHQLTSSTKMISLNDVTEKLANNIDRIQTTLAKTKSVMKSDGYGDFRSLVHELQELESLPCVLVASENDTNMNCLQIDRSIFCNLNEHIILRADDPVIYQLKTEDDAPDEALEDLPKACSLEEIKSQLLPSETVRPPVSNAGTLSADYAVEKSGRAASPLVSSRWSSSSSLSSNNSFAIEASQLLAPPDELVVGITFKAFVSHITSPSDFYIQRFGVRRKLESLQRELRRYGASFSQKKREGIVYQAGQYYMTMYSGDYNWSRCQILDFVGLDDVKILYIDFGNHQKVLKSNLKPLPDVLAQIPPLAVRCSIINCYPKKNNEWDPKVVSVMSRMMEGRGSSSITIVRKNQLNCLTIKLYKETETNIIDVGEALIFLEFAQTGPDDAFTPDIEKMDRPKPYPAQILLKAEDVQHRTVELTHVISPDEFYIRVNPLPAELRYMWSSMSKDYSTLDKRINESRIVYYPAVGMAVAIANEDGFWRRALVIEMLPKKFVKVFLVDDGPTWFVEWDKLRTLELRYFKLQPQAYRCAMADIQPKDGENWPKEAAALVQSYEGKNLRIASPEPKKHHTSVLLIHCDTEVDICVNARLVRDGMAKSAGPYGDIVEYPKVPHLVTSGLPLTFNQHKEFKIVQRPTPRVQQPLKPEKKEEIKMGLDELDDRLIRDPNGKLKVRATVLRVVNPGEFYVSLDYLDDKYKEMNAKMNEFYKNVNLNDVEQKWQVEDVCAVKTVDGFWKRGVVIKLQEDGKQHMEVNLVDEAVEVCVSTTTSGILAELDSQFRGLADRALECTLGGIVPAGSSSWTLTSISEMNDFLNTYKENLYLTIWKSVPGEEPKRILRVLLFGRKKSKPTATKPVYESWPTLNHQLRWKGCAKADEYTKWDHKGNIIDETNNAMEDEAVVLNSLLRSAFRTTPEGAVDLSKPVSECPESIKIKWPPADHLKEMKFIAKTTFVGSNCEIWIQDTLNAMVTLNVINEEATKLCEGTDPPDPSVPWETGDICLGRFHLDGKWYRSEILVVNATPSHHLVRFVDYGNEEYLECHELRHADGITMRPIQAHICYFDNLASIGESWLASHIHEIHSLLVDKHVCIELRELANDLLGIVSMILPDGRNALNEIVSRRLGIYRSLSIAESKKARSKSGPSVISDADVATIGSDSTVVHQNTMVSEKCVESEGGEAVNDAKVINWLNIYETEDKYELHDGCFQLMTIPPDVNEVTVDITSILSPKLCMIQISTTDNAELNSVLNSYDELVKTLQQEAGSQPNLKPPYLHKDCCCKFEGDDMWYRAVVIHDSSDVDGSLVIQYVDYGNVEKSPVDQVKQMKDEWFSVPVQSIPCHIEGYTFHQDISDSEAMVYLQSVLIDKPFVKAVIKKREKNLLVQFYNEEGNLLYQPLIDSQHLVPNTSG